MAQDCQSSATALVALLQVRLADMNVQVTMQPARAGKGELCPQVNIRFRKNKALLRIRYYGEGLGWKLSEAEGMDDLPEGPQFTALVTALDESDINVPVVFLNMYKASASA